MEKTKGRNSGLGRRSDWRHDTENRVKNLNKNFLCFLTVDDYEIQRRSHEAESRFLQHKNNEKDCRHFNRSPPPLRKTLPPNCKYFLRGDCKNGSACRFYHPVDRIDERRRETGSSSRPEKRARSTPDSRELDISQSCDETVAGSKRARLEQGLENVEEKRQQREIIERQIREADESFEERRWREMHAEDRQNIEEQRLRDIDTQRKEAHLKIKQMRPTVEFNELIYGELMQEWQYQDDMEKQRLREMQDKCARDEQLRGEERLRGIDRQRTEARKRLDQMKKTVTFNESSEVEESLQELGFKREKAMDFTRKRSCV